MPPVSPISLWPPGLGWNSGSIAAEHEVPKRKRSGHLPPVHTVEPPGGQQVGRLSLPHTELIPLPATQELPLTALRPEPALWCTFFHPHNTCEQTVSLCCGPPGPCIPAFTPSNDIPSERAAQLAWLLTNRIRGSEGRLAWGCRGGGGHTGPLLASSSTTRGFRLRVQDVATKGRTKASGRACAVNGG